MEGTSDRITLAMSEIERFRSSCMAMSKTQLDTLVDSMEYTDIDFG